MKTPSKAQHMTVYRAHQSSTTTATAVRVRKWRAAALVCVISGASLLGAVRPAHAECLGLAPPPPADVNICRTLVEDLLIPPVVTLEPTCDISGAECLLLPHCCVPGVCLAAPECVVTKEVIKAAGYVAHAGDVYCGPQEISADHLVSDIVNQRIPDLTTLSTGGINSALYQQVGPYIDQLECGARGLGGFKSIAATLRAEEGFPGAYEAIDYDNARIMARRDVPVLNLPPDDKCGMTIDSVIFLKDELYDAMVNKADWSWLDLALEAPDPTADEAMFCVLHELVHVRQYRELGRDRFFNEYFVDIVQKGYEDADFEAEAYEFSLRPTSWAETTIEAVRAENRH